MRVRDESKGIDLKVVDVGGRDGHFGRAGMRERARLVCGKLDLEREIPKLRAYASRTWRESQIALRAAPASSPAKAAEAAAFLDWALLELLLQSGLRIEEASELTALYILKRSLPNGSLYYLLHVKPSKFDRARVIPIGDGWAGSSPRFSNM